MTRNREWVAGGLVFLYAVRQAVTARDWWGVGPWENTFGAFLGFGSLFWHLAAGISPGGLAPFIAAVALLIGVVGVGVWLARPWALRATLAVAALGIVEAAALYGSWGFPGRTVIDAHLVSGLLGILFLAVLPAILLWVPGPSRSLAAGVVLLGAAVLSLMLVLVGFGPFGLRASIPLILSIAGGALVGWSTRPTPRAVV